MKAKKPTLVRYHAASGRARCRVCKGRIARGSDCVCEFAQVSYSFTTKFYMHEYCAAKKGLVVQRTHTPGPCGSDQAQRAQP